MSQERSYLDTNIIFHRKLSTKDIIATIESAIGHTFTYCSAFVVAEHKRVFLQTMRLLWVLFKENDSIDEVLKNIENHQWRSSQEKDRCMKIFNWFTANKNSTKDHTIAQLENMIFSYDSFHFGDIDVLESEINCPLARIKINSRKELMNVSLICPLRCSISNFLRNQRESLIQVQKGIEKINHLQLVVAILKKIDNNPEDCDENDCRTLADTIIILEAPEDFLICSNNGRDFSPISKTLGKKFLFIRY